MGHAFLLNLDADDELARPATYRGPAPAMRARIAALLPRLGALLAPDDVVVFDQDARGMEGRAWCPTPWALARLEKAGARLPDAPPLAVLQRVNHRRFSAELGQTLDGAAWAESLADVERAVRGGGSFLAKRPFGYAGRGRRKLASPLDSGDRAFLEATLREWGGVQIEPIVAILAEFALHGEVARDGGARFGAPTRQSCDAHGAWLGTEPAGDSLAADEAAALGAEARRVARALADARYFGPFGVDAYRYASSGAARFNPRGEINARFTMGWGVGMRLG